jgi:DNA polymerase-1
MVLVDGSSLVFRAYFAIPGNLATSKGLHTNATFGFATMFRKLFAGRKPDYGAVVFDHPGPTHRERKYPAYKAQRPSLPGDLVEQLEWIDKLVRAHHFPMLRAEGYEADDVIGTLARRGAEAGMEVVIVSGDKDFAQLIDGRVRMLDTLRDITFDAELVKKKWGVRPEQMVDLLALMGDSVDNIPGVDGIGQKGAASLLEKYGSLDEILRNLGELKGRQRTALEAHRAEALLSRELATIDRSVPLATELAELRIEPPGPAELNALFKELEFYSLLSEEARISAEASSAQGTQTLLDSAAAIEEALRELARSPLLAVHPMFEGAPVVGRLVGLAFAPEPGRAYYLPALEDASLAPFLAILQDPERPKLAHNVKELWIVLQRRGVHLEGASADTMLGSFLVDPTKLLPHRLDQVVKEYLQRTIPPIARITGSGQEERPLGDLAPAEVADHACRRVDAVAGIWPLLEKRLAALGLVDQLRRYDLPLSFVLGRMELDGIKVDRDDLRAMGDEFAARLAEYERTIHRLAGCEFNIGSTKQLSKVLFEDLKLPVIRRTKTGYSTDSEVLERLAPKHEIARHLVEHRKLSKLINTYTDVLQQAVNPTTGRIHATFQQTTSATGRLITTDPDLQRTPVRTPEGRRIRRAFIADPGTRLISADWSQIELRILAHVSGDPVLRESFRAGMDVHRRTASELFHCPLEAVTPEQRNVGKTVNFATIYGQGATALGQILGIPRKEAEQYIAGYFSTYAGVRRWLDETIDEAKETGYVTTLFGRRRFIPELSSNNVIDAQAGERMAANTPIQGSAADICKLAMLQIADRLRSSGLAAKMLLQVHDELVFEAPLAEVEAVKALVKEAMEHALPLEVPLVVDAGVGDSWAAAH